MNVYKDLMDSVEEVYNQWLMIHCADEIHCEDDLLRCVENRHRYDEFVDFIKGLEG